MSPITKEREYLLKATSVALKTSTFTTARTYLTRLLEQTPAQDPRRTALLLDLGEPLATTGDFPGALTLFEEARDLARTDAERALEVIGMARAHPAWTHDDQRNTDGWLEEWAVDPATIEAAYARGAALDWDTTIRELLNEDPANA